LTTAESEAFITQVMEIVNRDGARAVVEIVPSPERRCFDVRVDPATLSASRVSAEPPETDRVACALADQYEGQVAADFRTRLWAVAVAIAELSEKASVNVALWGGPVEAPTPVEAPA
jgi:hypothetical protein